MIAFVCATAVSSCPMLFGQALAVPPAPMRHTVAEAIADANRDFVPDHSGDTMVLTGVVTYEPRVLGQSATIAALQDGSGAIWIFAERSSDMVGKITRGDLTEVTGTIGQFHGRNQIQIRPGGLRVLGRGPVPEPRDATAREIRSGRFQCELVRLHGHLKTDEDQLGRKLGLVLEDSSGKIPILITDRFLQSFDFLEHLLQSSSMTVVAIPTVDAVGVPKAGDYRLTPRDPKDFTFPLLIPYREIANRQHVAAPGGCDRDALATPAPRRAPGAGTRRAERAPAGGQGGRRGGEPLEERVPREHEPRDPDADERRTGHDGPAPRHGAERRAARLR